MHFSVDQWTTRRQSTISLLHYRFNPVLQLPRQPTKLKAVHHKIKYNHSHKIIHREP